ncbi:MAG: ISSpu19 transposase [Osedax symbiont Rs1]|nr:MAG: ISSpu19 transposase [Osedax symbiont Rs1]
MDNCDSKKEAVAYTYKGHDGYSPIAADLGLEGWCVACVLRPGNQHANKEFLHTLDRILPRVRSLCDNLP